MDDERRAEARRVWSEVMGVSPPDELPNLWTEKTADFVMAEVWNRPGLTRKERRFITLTGVAASGARMPMKAHLRAALVTGDMTVAELEEWTLHASVYLGWPSIAPAAAMITELADELA